MTRMLGTNLDHDEIELLLLLLLALFHASDADREFALARPLGAFERDGHG